MPLPLRAIRESDRLLADFDGAARLLARRLASGQIDLRTWQIAFLQEVRRAVVGQYRLGYGARSLPEGGRLRPGGYPDPRSPIGRLDQSLLLQGAYIGRFADQMATAAAAGQPLSEAQIAARSALYGGAARAEFYRAAERARPEDTLWEYRARDDGGTCGPCLSARGVYPSGEGPYPGSVCLGRSHCRCRRVPATGRSLRQRERQSRINTPGASGNRARTPTGAA